MEQEADAARLAAQHLEGETPLHRYLVALYESGEVNRLISQIAGYVRRAGLAENQAAYEIALEVFQDVMVEVLRKQESFDPSLNGRAWLLRFAANIILRRRDALFKLNKREQVASDHPEAYGAAATGETLSDTEILDRLYALHAAKSGDSPFGQPSPEQAVVEATLWDSLLSQLAPEDRQVIELTVLHGLKGAEVAQDLGISTVNARVRLCRALPKLRALWQAEQQRTRQINVDGTRAGNARHESARHESARHDEEKHSYES